WSCATPLDVRRCGAMQVEYALDEGRQRNELQLRLGQASELGKLADDGRDALDFSQNRRRGFFEVLVEGWILPAPQATQRLHRCADGSQRIFDFVRHAVSDLALGGDALARRKLCTQAS